MEETNKLSVEQLVEGTRRILESSFWIPGLDGEDMLARFHDDTDGKQRGILVVSLPGEGDIIVTTDSHLGPALRFRSASGGGKSLRVRNALMILAWAMKLDNEEHPQYPPR